MFGQKFFPYSTLQELNLDWILTKVKNILRFVPDDGYVGQILRRTKDGAEWSDEQGGGGAVNSVNGQTGTVVLTATDVGALPDSYTAPVTSVNTKTGAVVIDKTDIGLGNVANVAQYSASNPPPYPVTSVNTKTGAVVLDKTDIGLENVANVAQYSASNPPPYPVTSVNGQTGNVVLSTPSYVESTPTLTRTSGSGSVAEAKCYRYGGVVHIFLGFENSASVAAGGNLFIGTISGIPFPKIVAIGTGYYTNTALGATIDSVGNIQIRVLISALGVVSSPSRARIEITYITE